ncbi:hypothetical protein CGRA01v4_03133 [Colletotrichum graminicola]|nr:hypothetical protein CGRA01v4_03133 [Colletotrichum graminicola]
MFSLLLFCLQRFCSAGGTRTPESVGMEMSRTGVAWMDRINHVKNANGFSSCMKSPFAVVGTTLTYVPTYFPRAGKYLGVCHYGSPPSKRRM